jgi:hypothetical protein
MLRGQVNALHMLSTPLALLASLLQAAQPPMIEFT